METVSSARPRLTPAQAAEAFARWQAGEAVQQIAASFAVCRTTIYNSIAPLRNGAARPLRQRFTAAQLEEAMQRWNEGEALRSIATTLQVPVAVLALRTEAERAGGRPRKQRFTDLQITDAVQRWYMGETMRQIAQRLGVSETYLLRVTKDARKALPPKATPLFPPVISRKLTETELTEIMRRWRRGESLRQIAREIGVCSSHVVSATRIMRGPAPSSILTPDLLTDILERLAKGEILRCLARQYQVTPRTLLEEIVLLCWKRGETLDVISMRLGKQRQVIRRIVVRHGYLRQ